KGLQRGELRVKADYMADEVKLDWARVERIESKSTFIISLVDGKLFTSAMRMMPSDSNHSPNFIIDPAASAVHVHQLEVIRIVPVDPGFWKRLEGSIDFGFSFTSGNDQYQTGLSATATHRTGDHSFTASIDSSFSGQREGTSTTRKEFSFDYRKQLTPRYFVGGFFDLLQSDQQSLDLRTSVGGLVGRNLRQTESSRLSVFGGVVGTREKYSSSIGKPESTNADALAGVDLSIFHFKATDISSRFS